MSDVANVRLVRRSSFIFSLRKFWVYVDGIKIGSITNGGQFDFNIAAGHRTVVLKVSWCKSESVEIVAVPDHSFELECGTRLDPKLFILLIGLVVAGLRLVQSTSLLGVVLGMAFSLSGVILGVKLTRDTIRPGKFLYLCKRVDASLGGRWQGESRSVVVHETAVTVPVATANFEQQLRTLAKLRDDGVITDEDFGRKKKEILGL